MSEPRPDRPPAGAETVFALSSAPGRAGVAVVRVSGPGAGGALRRIAGGLPEARRARLARLRAPDEGADLDRGLVLWFPGPASATGEDLAEFHLHGGPAVVAGVIEALSALPGLRPAEAGEFTRRAFDNGKLDLSEVEGLADLIAAETAAQRRQALRQMSGALSARAEAWRGKLLQAMAHLEAAIDFAEEELPEDLAVQARPVIAALAGEIGAALDDGGRGERLRAGLSVAILGPPNVGKSSLLNALARREVAIVAEQAGTTRDVLEVHLDLGGYPVTLADTAGLRVLSETSGQAAVEAEGIRRARARAEAADVQLLVLDIREAGPSAPTGFPGAERDRILVLNKADLAGSPETGALADQAPCVVSAKTGAGLEALIARLAEQAAQRMSGGGAEPAITRARHRAALGEAAAALARAAAAREAELMAEDLRLAARALGRIAGRVDVEDLLDVIFRDFCIGK